MVCRYGGLLAVSVNRRVVRLVRCPKDTLCAYENCSDNRVVK